MAKEKVTRLTIAISPAMRIKIRKAAANRDMCMGEFIKMVVESFINVEEKRK